MCAAECCNKTRMRAIVGGATIHANHLAYAWHGRYSEHTLISAVRSLHGFASVSSSYRTHNSIRVRGITHTHRHKAVTSSTAIELSDVLAGTTLNLLTFSHALCVRICHSFRTVIDPSCGHDRSGGGHGSQPLPQVRELLCRIHI